MRLRLSVTKLPNSFVGVLAFAICSIGIAADRSTEHAACTAISALAELDKSEASLLEQEQSAVDTVVSSGDSPISVGETYLHDNLGLLLEGALSALRHALVAGVLTEQVDLAEASSLDAQLSALLSVHLKEPLFFWHGPRRMVLPRLRRLLGQESIKLALSSSCSSSSSLRSTLELRHLLRADSGTQDASPKTVPHQVPLVGLVADDENCGDDRECDLTEAIAQARRLNNEGVIHVLLSTSSDSARSKIGRALQSITDVWLSAVVPAHLVEYDIRISDAVAAILKSTSWKHINLLWLPYAAFTKTAWPKVKHQLDTLLKKGMIGAFGAQMHIPTGTVAKKIFEKREPAPVAWLASHDVLRPVDKEAAAVAHELGIAVVAQPREQILEQVSASVYLGLAVGQDLAKQQAAHLKWIMQSGFGLVAKSSANMKNEAVFQRLQEIEVPKSGFDLLDVVSSFAQPLSSKEGADLAQGDDQSIEGKLRYWQGRLPKVDDFPTSSGDSIKEDTSSAHWRPGLSASSLSDLAEQARLYKHNNHAIYRENFFDDATYAAVVNETRRLWSSEDIEGNCNLDGRNRLGGYVLDHPSRESSLYKLIYGNEHFRRWVSEVNGEGTMWPSDFPIELREYGPDSRGMGCHSDLLMYAVAKKDTEFAFTVDNDSKCRSSIVDSSGKETKTLTKANSMIMVRANAATHCVYPTQSGHRTILKFIYVGDYRKSQAFPNYKGNECGPGNINNKLLQARRDQYNAESLEL